MADLCNLQRLLAPRGAAAALARATGISKTNISFWKNGERRPSAEHLPALEQYFGYSSTVLLSNDGWLLAGDDPVILRMPKKSPAEAEDGWPPERIALEDAISDFGCEELERMSEYALFLKSKRTPPAK